MGKTKRMVEDQNEGVEPTSAQDAVPQTIEGFFLTKEGHAALVKYLGTRPLEEVVVPYNIIAQALPINATVNGTNS